MVSILVGAGQLASAQKALPAPNLGEGGEAAPAVPLSPGVIPEVKISTSVDTVQVPQKKTLRLTLELGWDKRPNPEDPDKGTCELDFDFPEPPQAEGLVAVGNSMRTVTEIKGQVQRVSREYIYEYLAQEQGQTEITPVTVAYRRVGSDEDLELKAGAIPIVVLPPKAGLRDMLSGQWPKLVIAGVLLCAVLALIATTLWERRKGKVKVKDEPEEVELSLEEQALTMLQENDTYRIAGRYPDYFLGISRLVQDYIAKRYGIRTQGQTSGKIAGLLKEKIGQEQAERLRSLLLLCDKVKFAGHNPSPIEMDQAFEDAKGIIRLEALGRRPEV